MPKAPLTPAERSMRARIAANTRWAREPDRLAATKPGRDAAWQRLLAVAASAVRQIAQHRVWVVDEVEGVVLGHEPRLRQ